MSRRVTTPVIIAFLESSPFISVTVAFQLLQDASGKSPNFLDFECDGICDAKAAARDTNKVNLNGLFIVWTAKPIVEV
jgi:hypothetical protein